MAGEGIAAVEGVLHRAGGVVLLDDAGAVDALLRQPVRHQLALGLAVLGHAAGEDDEGRRIGLGQGAGGLEAPQQDLVHGAIGIEGIAQGDDGAAPLLLAPSLTLLEGGGDHPVHGGEQPLQIGGATGVELADPLDVAIGFGLVALEALPGGQIGVEIQIVRRRAEGLLEQGDGSVHVAVVDLGVGRRDEQIGAIGLELVRLQ
ncbi:hypothetical protein D3C71_1251950 [compost metagenome]